MSDNAHTSVSDQNSISILVKNALGLLTIASAMSLVCGFLIVNLYLGQFGFWDFNFLKFEYVSAGILFLLFTGLIAFFFLVALVIHEEFKEHFGLRKTRVKKLNYWFFRILTWILEIFIYYEFWNLNYSFLNMFVRHNNSSAGLFVNAALVVWIVIICILSFNAFKAYKRLQSPSITSPENLRSIILKWLEFFRIFYLPLFFVVLLLIFSILIYPFIPRSFGGGAQVNIMVYLKSSSDLPSSFSAKLIHQSPDSILIDASSSTYLLPADQISHIQYLDSAKGFQNFIEAVKD
ncbi:MAG: hypothetical protein P4M11_02480 [Candidatus Pacebacteria bacterium]|nr:hypothetical protein [Candidatus Paceibacterota bacterium]